jgi:tRNA(Ser,Leu) C12 N-acetylase TAN1
MKMSTESLRKLIKESFSSGQYLVIVGDSEKPADEVEVFGLFNSNEEIIEAVYSQFMHSNHNDDDISDKALEEIVKEQMMKTLNKRSQIDSYLSGKFWKIFKL